LFAVIGYFLFIYIYVVANWELVYRKEAEEIARRKKSG